MALSIVQSAKNGPNNATSITVTFGAAVTPGNLIVIGVGVSDYTADRSATASTGSGWSSTHAQNASVDLWVFYRLATGSDSTAFSFSISGSTEYVSIIGYEVREASATLNGSSLAYDNTGADNYVTPSVTPSVTGCLALAFLTTDGDQSINSVTSGWTLDQSANGIYHPLFAAHRNALTTDTSTAITVTFDGTGESDGVGGTLLIAPSGGGGGTSAKKLAALGVG